MPSGGPSGPGDVTGSIGGAGGLADAVGRVWDRAQDRTSRLCKLWLVRRRRGRALLDRWAEVEADLARRLGWRVLSDQARATIPEGAELARLDAAMDRQNARLTRLTPRIAAAPAASLQAVVLKLAVAAELVGPEDNPEGHGLIRSAAQDLAALL
jgi:hypothetical protein